MEPLLHLVRNAVSHGIETPGGARRPGKAGRRDRPRCAPRAVG